MGVRQNEDGRWKVVRDTAVAAARMLAVESALKNVFCGCICGLYLDKSIMIVNKVARRYGVLLM